jgi:hypothetical protein
MKCQIVVYATIYAMISNAVLGVEQNTDGGGIEGRRCVRMPNTREKLIELLSDVQYLGGLEEKIADHLIANSVTVQDSKVVKIDQFNKWIPVTERLPEAGKKVICCGSEGGLFVARTRECAGRVLIIDNKSAVQRKATHWMPLPPLPKGE